ncbi:MAG: Uma2 family endonuclease [Oscillatoriaceae cyanobacterium]
MPFTETAMIALNSHNYISPEEYLEMERHSPIKHEYMDGEIYAMAGTGGIHNIISGNFYVLLRSHLQSSPCRTYFADLKVNVERGKRFFYPDLIVTCDPKDDPSCAYVEAPQVIIEVLSESTESFDRGKKFQYYRTIPSLQDYILISSQEYLVETFHRTENNLWLLQTYQGLEAIVHIESLAIDAPLGEIYATLDLTTQPIPPSPPTDGRNKDIL